MVVTLCFSCLVLINLMGCIWWFLAVAQGIDRSWAAPDALGKFVDLQTSNDATRWLWSVYFAVTMVRSPSQDRGGLGWRGRAQR